MPGLLSSQRKVGPAADENELEYISALHQTCGPGLRMDGTISSSDIATMLNSKYGIIISSEEAKDIAVNLCGAKAPKQLFQGKKSILDTIKSVGFRKKSAKEDFQDDGAESKEKLPEEDLTNEGQAGKEDEDVHFNLVQLLALLLIPNMLEHAKNKKMSIFEHSFDTLLEPLPDSVEEKFRETGEMNIDILRNLLTSAGDIDSSRNEELMEKMLTLYHEKKSSIQESFIHCLTSDVMESYDADASDSKNKNPSTFFDVFGQNWEECSDTGTNLRKVPTFSFVDYANQSFASESYNILIWACYIFTVLYYWLGVTQSEVSNNLSKVSCTGYGCSVAKKIMSWSLTGSIVGTFGVCSLVTMGFGNVASNRRRTFWSMMMVLLYLVPFVFLMNYWKDTPHNFTTNTTYYDLCPPDWVYSDESQGMGPIPIVFETSCYPFRTLCLNHLELQGKKLVPDPFKLTFKEDRTCGLAGVAYRLFNFGHMCANGVCGDKPVNTQCDDDKNCSISNYQGACGYSFDIDETYTDLTQEKICCPSGRYIFTQNGAVCSHQPEWSPCTSDLVCESGKCTDGFCEHTSQLSGIYSNCSAHAECDTGFCNPLSLTCTTEWWVCPAYLHDLQTGNLTEQWFLYEIFSALHVPPVCTTKKIFCERNRFFNSFGCDCDCAIDHLVDFKVLKRKDQSDPTLKNEKKTFENLDRLEISLRDYFFVMCLLCSGIIGIFVICTQIYIIVLSNNQRTREYESKCAAVVKTNKLIENAVATHQRLGSEKDLEGVTMRKYFKELHKEESTGGIYWILSNLLSHDLQGKEGIHISSRIFIANMVQLVILVVFVITASLVVNQMANGLDKFIFENKPLTKEDVEKMDYEEFFNLDKRRLISAYVPNPFIDKFPQGWMIKAAAIPGIVIASLIGLFSTVIYIPSYVTTTLKMRSGIIPTFRDPQFLSIRKSSDQVSLNLGNIIFSLLGACLLSFLCTTIVTLIFTWSYTREVALPLVFTVIGIIASTIIKMVLQGVCRSRFFSALYRKNVRGANISNLFFECWYIATATLTIVVRIGTIFANLLVGISRTDVPFIHPDVGIEKPASSFRCTILVEEAHCHPYLDRLSGIYLRRLRDGERFGKPECQAWRSLFVIGLCPWMIKKQVSVLLDSEKDFRDKDMNSEDFENTKVDTEDVEKVI